MLRADDSAGLLPTYARAFISLVAKSRASFRRSFGRLRPLAADDEPMKNAYPLLLLTLSPLTLQPIARAEDAAPAAPAQSGLPRVVITGSRQEDNYRVEGVDSIGPLGTTPILDIPYSIGILPEDLIEELPGGQLQGRLEVSAAGGLPGAAGARTSCGRRPAACRAATSRTPGSMA